MKSLSLFDTEGKKQEAIVILTSGRSSEFWGLIKKILNVNIEYLAERIISETDENGNLLEGKALIEARMKVLVFRDVARTPEHLIKTLSGEDIENEPIDPYVTIKEQKETDKKVEAEENELEGFDSEVY